MSDEPTVEKHRQRQREHEEHVAGEASWCEHVAGLLSGASAGFHQKFLSACAGGDGSAITPREEQEPGDLPRITAVRTALKRPQVAYIVCGWRVDESLEKPTME